MSHLNKRRNTTAESNCSSGLMTHSRSNMSDSKIQPNEPVQPVWRGVWWYLIKPETCTGNMLISIKLKKNVNQGDQGIYKTGLFFL